MNPAALRAIKQKRFKALAGVGTRINRLVELTGTPSPNGLDDLWAQIYLLDGGERLGKDIRSSGNGILIRENAGTMWYITTRQSRGARKAF